MSLDRQRLLNELGSVMNQLQSADCGCMGKLFSNQSQGHGSAVGSPLPTCGGCRRGCYHGHGYAQSTPGGGEPYSNTMNPAMNNSMSHCMGHCNPPKLYADTYSYLNNNLMQPVVKEVYDDLKSISPANTIMNNPLANQMGFANASPNPVNQGIPGNMGNPMQNMREMENGSGYTESISGSQLPANAMGGMGPQIVNMIMGDNGSKPSNRKTPGLGGQPTDSMANPQFPRGQNNAASMESAFGVTQGGNTAAFTHPMSQFTNPPTQYVHQTNMNENVTQSFAPQAMSQMGNINNATSQMVNRSMVAESRPVGNANSGAGQMPATNQQQNMYGQHTQGMMKFNEMFPGVMQGGDLGFDPMAIAIQMNPANKQKAAMDTMQKMMSGGRQIDGGGNTAAMKPVVNVPKTTMDSVSKNVLNAQIQQQSPVQHPTQPMNQQIIASGQQQLMNGNTGSIPSQPLSTPKQQIYAAVTEQQQMQSYQQPSEPLGKYQQEHIPTTIDPNTGVPLTSRMNFSGHEVMADPNTALLSNTITQANVKEPIFPADISRNHPVSHSKLLQGRNEYNTLGQPIEMIPAGIFHPPEPNLPQTLSPQPQVNKLRDDYMRYSNVKGTVSKTSLVGNKPVGRTPSRSQLQHIYNQYKGSQSFTQQNVRPSVHGGTFSEGKLNVPAVNANPPRQVPVEKVGGDTTVNNQIPSSQLTNKMDQVMGQVGDAPIIQKPMGDGASIKAPLSPIPARQAKLRNGLQDVVYTSYPSSAAWSFHGNHAYRPVSVSNRFRSFR